MGYKYNYKWLVNYGGGIGPDVWDAEMVVTAENILEAVQIATKKLDMGECSDYFITEVVML